MDESDQHDPRSGSPQRRVSGRWYERYLCRHTMKCEVRSAKCAEWHCPCSTMYFVAQGQFARLAVEGEGAALTAVEVLVVVHLLLPCTVGLGVLPRNLGAHLPIPQREKHGEYRRDDEV